MSSKVFKNVLLLGRQLSTQLLRNELCPNVSSLVKEGVSNRLNAGISVLAIRHGSSGISRLALSSSAIVYKHTQSSLLLKCSLIDCSSQRHLSATVGGIQKHISALDTKRPIKKRAVVEEEDDSASKIPLLQRKTTEIRTTPASYRLPFSDMHDSLHVTAKYTVGTEPREIYMFREGSVVFWNVPELERNTLRRFLREFEESSYEDEITDREREEMKYTYVDLASKLSKGRIFLNADVSPQLDKYAFSNSMVLSVKLGIWEASLDRYVESIKWVTDTMKLGKQMTISREDVLRKTGELFALRHLINLSSDLLDTPDFYWDREHLEPIYEKMCIHLNIARRTRVMNEKLNLCCELAQLLKDHLSDRHHTRLEWMIIILIAVEVCFELVKWIPFK
ncbi:PREDICTED: required for meiotic nuclear division protein 1 homolog isoform X2 [Priapulus caudatus]|uniref:Required for meiotic nuclear division protein 1 homolog isoform X2 n=1 Tax=Priapulus caudatus TaxID=37621 RepID=A0ABM1E753_PRICU|nr:PREDICTED: required for meiotic nuclear division protein 1 homolog isoform X2 [Priapulus caudatus]